MLAFTSDQLRLLVDASHHYEQYLHVERSRQASPAWMSWRTSGKGEYLRQADRNGIRKSLGVRSPETEQLFADFERSNVELKEKRSDINKVLAERAAQMKAIRMGKIPYEFARIIRAYDVANVLEHYLWVGGTHAILAYECMAGYWMDSSLAATEDLDLVWSGLKHELVTFKPPAQLMKTLKDIDSTYTVNAENRFQARNSKGMIIDFITSKQGEASTLKETLKPIGIDGQEWLQLLPPINTVIIDTKGLPVKLCAPHPALFALHKYWVSQRADRNPLKVKKDIAQASAVLQLIAKALPQYQITDDILDILPSELLDIYHSLNGKQTQINIDTPEM